MQQYIIDFVNSATEAEINAYLDSCGATIIKSFNAFEKVVLVECLGIPPASDLVEHIKDDVDALVQIKSKMLPGALLAIYVPALPILYSEMDAKVGHYRRYTKKELEHKVKAAGLKIDNCYYNDFMGVPAMLSLKIFGYKGKSGIGSKKSLIIYDRIIYPISIFLDCLFMKRVIGKNLLLIARN
jgi:hypothetical protein